MNHSVYRFIRFLSSPIILGWVLMLCSVFMADTGLDWFSQLDQTQFKFSLFLSGLLIFCLTVLSPVIGTPNEPRGFLNSILIFFTTLPIFAKYLSHSMENFLAIALEWIRGQLESGLSHFIGEVGAATLTTPFYLLLMVAILVSLAYRSSKAFLFIFICVTAYGCLSADIPVLTATVTWLAGLSLVVDRPTSHPMQKQILNGLSTISCLIVFFIVGPIYILSPVDLVPDAIPIAGWLDDLAIQISTLIPLGGAVLREINSHTKNQKTELLEDKPGSS